jgi:CNT family concentrative nucleoside transporter
MFPESEPPPAGARSLAGFGVEKTAVNGIDALCRGASEGLMLALNVLGMLIAFVAVIALLNGLFLGAQHAVGLPGVTLQQVMGWLNAPFAWLMGVPAKDCATIGQMLGERIVLNEFVGYLDLSTFVTTHPGQLDSRSVTLASYALCGFANFGSIAIQIGGIGALAPARRGDLARIGLRAMVAGLLACYLFASVIGVIL